MSSRAAHCLALALALAGCHVAPQDIGREPHLTPIGSGIVAERYGNVHEVSPRPASGQRNSTWQDASADLFRDARAVRVGDIVTVKISIRDKASFDSAINRSRDSKFESSGKLAFNVDAFGYKKQGEASADTSAGGNTSTEGRGAITRSESIELLVAAIVTDVLPNGNLMLAGSQEVRVNFEVRVLHVGGIVRPRDIATDNSIAYDKIAEARISYGGRGRISEVQQPGLGQQIVDLLWPY